MGFLNQSFMIPTQFIMLVQEQIRTLHILLQYPFTVLLILQNLHEWNQCIILSFAILHKWMLLIILIPSHSHPSTHSHSTF